jgi:hypothetical protein
MSLSSSMVKSIVTGVVFDRGRPVAGLNVALCLIGLHRPGRLARCESGRARCESGRARGRDLDNQLLRSGQCGLVARCSRTLLTHVSPPSSLGFKEGAHLAFAGVVVALARQVRHLAVGLWVDYFLARAVGFEKIIGIIGLFIIRADGTPSSHGRAAWRARGRAGHSNVRERAGGCDLAS